VRSGSTITISLNGTVVLTHTLTPTQLTTLGTGTRAGLYSDSNNVRFSTITIS
jgi:hypothetical protein